MVLQRTIGIVTSVYTRFFNVYGEINGLLRTYMTERYVGCVTDAFDRMAEFDEVLNVIGIDEGELALKSGYLEDMLVLFRDIRNDQEYEALTILFGEFKMSMKMLYDESNSVEA